MGADSQSVWSALVGAIPPNYWLPIAALAGFIMIFFMFLFRVPLGRAITNLRSVTFGNNVKIEFGKGVQEVLKDRKRNTDLELVSPDLPQGGSKTTDAAARDLVIESWGRLKQTVQDVAKGRMQQPGARGKIGEAVGILIGLGVFSADYGQQIRLLYDLGKKVSDSKGKLSMQDAHAYKELVDTLVEWIRCNIIDVKPPERAAEPPPRQTQVAGYYTTPNLGRPSAILVGVAGTVQGRQFPIEKELFRIGANHDNDLVIEGDDFVSGNHAYLRYDKGALFISDQKSRNGTYLNDSRLKETAQVVNPADHIRIGNCTFEVMPAPAY